jgi:hypothetical protein
LDFRTGLLCRTMSPMKRILHAAFAASLTALILGGCQTVPEGFTTEPGSNNLVARTSGFAFPPKVGDFTRIGPIQYDSAGQDVSVKYEAGKLVILDVYDYPARDLTLAGETRTRENEIKASHPDARLISEQPITIRPRGESQRGVKAVFTFAQNFRSDISGPYKSQFLLFKLKNRFIAYRATYPSGHAVRAEAIINDFVNRLAWPAH